MTGRTDLGDFLRKCRAGLSPEEAGLDGLATGRRVRGLRREEVAMLAGVSVDYYTRLEQGRHSSPSEAVVEALGRVFRLDAAARAHLADLARPVRRAAEQAPPQRVRPAMQQLIASMTDHPALILGRRTDVLAANPLARALLTDWTSLAPRHRNYVRWIVLDPAAREVFLDWPTVAAEAVGTLRLYAGRHPDDVRLNELVGELTIKSADFRTWWNGHQVHERTHGTKRMTHAAVGPITLRYEALALPGDPDQTLFVYNTDPGSASHDNLRLLGLLLTKGQPEAAGEPESTRTRGL
ncbi:helix-turn-helix domain-containing protein [Actinoplanes sp. LDG1-06]|uniref:Helix-turn-helix domain-containing protein n=1 Tax=Paractinoplanes ovalisporus TaxID=2810368 RepID=A0ABS2A537_9ACTN|nr:helix-turn-helix transcriptional regulator [Actinoplanes ovalisporus]MBM2614912.1 helix-turn-helix domain-containing protein [Actinoplanes ovalisporus]